METIEIKEKLKQFLNKFDTSQLPNAGVTITIPIKTITQAIFQLTAYEELKKRISEEKFIDLIGNCYTAREKAQAIVTYLRGV